MQVTLYDLESQLATSQFHQLRHPPDPAQVGFKRRNFAAPSGCQLMSLLNLLGLWVSVWRNVQLRRAVTGPRREAI